MLRELNRCCQRGQFASFYRESSSGFYYGRVLSVNENDIALYLISSEGDYDGILIEKTDEITNIETDGKYDRKMKKLFSEEALPPFDFTLGDKFFDSILKIASETKKIVALELMDSGYDDVVGFVDVVNGDMCKLTQTDEFGCLDGFAYVKISSITRISYDSKKEQRLLRLLTQNKP